MDQADIERVRQRFSDEVRTRFPGAPIERVEVLQYGQDPSIEPGQLLAKVILEPPAGEDAGDADARVRRMDAFQDEHRKAVRDLRGELDRLPGSAILEFTVGGEPREGKHGPVMRLAGGPRTLTGGGGGEGQFTPVMARLGQDDLETLDTLITAGIAASRAEAVRWTLARIRERPAYEQLRARAREIEDLKTQF
jgi:hypothetical protein